MGIITSVSEHVPELCNAYLYSVVSVNSPCSVEVWCPKDLKRSSRDITELDVVLAEFEKITANYRYIFYFPLAEYSKSYKQITYFFFASRLSVR